MPAVAWLTSARDHRVIDALQSWLAVAPLPPSSTLPVVVISRRAPAASDDPCHVLVRRLVAAGIAHEHVDVAAHRATGDAEWRARADLEIARHVARHGAKAVLMLGHGWWSTSELYDTLPCVNVHPAVPGGPIGTERDVIDALLATGATTTGLTAHVVGAARDRGEVVASVTAPLPARRRGWPRHTLDRAAVAAVHTRLVPELVVETMRRLTEVNPSVVPNGAR